MVMVRVNHKMAQEWRLSVSSGNSWQTDSVIKINGLASDSSRANGSIQHRWSPSHRSQRCSAQAQRCLRVNFTSSSTVNLGRSFKKEGNQERPAEEELAGKKACASPRPYPTEMPLVLSVNVLRMTLKVSLVIRELSALQLRWGRRPSPVIVK